MRYIYGVAAFILAISLAFIIFTFFPSEPGKNDIAIVVNDRAISRDEFDRQFRSRPENLKDSYGSRRKEDFVQQRIMRELLIQEAKRLGIDREEPFRKSVQNFYEQSLIKILMDRKYASLDFKVSEAEVDRYLLLSDKTIHFTVQRFKDRAAANQGKALETTRRTALFQDLANELKAVFITLSEGKSSGPIPVDSHYEIYRLDAITETPGAPHVVIERAVIKKRLGRYQRQKAMQDWLGRLRQQADIKVYIDAHSEAKP